MTETTDNSPHPSKLSDQQRPATITSSIAFSVLFGIAAAMLLHTVQWLFGWGWGSLWGFMSSVVILSLGCSPWVLDPEGWKHTAGLGAGVGGAMGIAYGWFSGGLLAGALFCASVGSWAAWIAGKRGLTTKAAQAGAVIVCLSAFHLSGILSPSSGESLSGDPLTDDYWYAEAFDEWELVALKQVCAITNPFTSEVSLTEQEKLARVMSLGVNESEAAYKEAKQALDSYKGHDVEERNRLRRRVAIQKGTRDGYLRIAAPFLTR